ncbi:bifunctional phosphoribosyl-AMP cyclohydrolase/phosphoribosyl-ATP diphosphatase HisIE [Paenibacillus crassostreae]|uniref:Histidine biosynthesis bifunctional protein HisIE n=1 Tax=Paenibacillus crassostreae TaxID=1763538 RepID=A0A167GEP8_9BACL|nr:bifunctional phosphoribosyl-AMP cyclohydrolase/phosphoribosyl-ATP diphosphatase HisIE [Paenibacillus crassostreae]AOZ92733.1 bifunctional phosphoribosyl-AMP cyclohydrolase/phosphoribosyl-ATP pyrophosphatase [Paenibacillus crassostreae]OAB77505.1 bifunctional phosphoribosyl-AMP cyclohydrolase/phosphoribosyl-ATP pyrophosphatase [Paenibacillus crassostreae]
MSNNLNQVGSLEQIQNEIRFDEAGLVPAIVQDATTKNVLMMAYMNLESLKLSVESGETWFWSRSRQQLWHKGATSGNTQRITSLSYDCDGDTLLIQVLPQGPACHTGNVTCFFNEVSLDKKVSRAIPANDRFAVLAELEQIIAQREKERPEGAYTTYLFEKGVDKILKKVGEETAEAIIAAKNKDNDELRLEVSDLIYHLLVLLEERKLPLDEIMTELSRRHERPRRD